ncbi:MAG TPA: HD domain-containing phosphohydrolase [Planctomycetota bacterium]|nr:HD domain-containing phosphohydrolase [Planctomycetota bacterium]
MSSSVPAPAVSAVQVLVVDDEPQIRDILATALRRDGYAVTVRGSAREALDDLGRNRFDLLVTDLKMPEMNGLDLIRAAKRNAPSMGSILITAFASTETAVSALRSGADDYLMKPFGLDDLRRVVERVLSDRRSDARDQEALHLVREENDSLRRQRRDASAALVAARRDLKLSRRDLERRVRDLEFVTELADLLAGEDLEAIVATTARITGRRFHAHVTRIEADVGAGVIEAEHREGVEPIALPLPLGALLVDRARREPTGVFRDEVLGQGRPLEALAAGLVVAGRPAGGIVLLRPLIAKDEGDTALLAMLARALKPALEAEGHRRRAEANALGVARGLLEALEGRLVGRRGHAERVAEVVRRACDGLGLSPRERSALLTAAHLHDIGEVGVPEELLSRAGPLNSEEMDVVRAHAAVGARLLEPLGDAARLIRHHHERPDGLGYPDGLREDQIPFGAALIGVAEAYDAMTHARPYHPVLAPGDARREILRLRGVQFVPSAVDVVLGVIPA